MKNVTFTYNAIEDGMEGEAFTLRHDVNSFCMACERCRGREYVDESIKTVEIEEV